MNTSTTIGILLTIALLTANPSICIGADDKSDNQQPETVKTSNIFEVRPITDDLGSSAVSELGLSVNFAHRIGEKLFLTGELFHTAVSRSDDDIKFLKEDADDDELLVQRKNAQGALFGLTHYGKPEASSWFFGGQTGIMQGKFTYVVEDLKVNDKVTGIPLIFHAGYRWLFLEKMTISLGGRGGMFRAASRSVSGSTDSSKKKVRDEQPDFLPGFVFGVGVLF